MDLKLCVAPSRALERCAEQLVGPPFAVLALPERPAAGNRLEHDSPHVLSDDGGVTVKTGNQRAGAAEIAESR
jgi:hypothetical protein